MQFNSCGKILSVALQRMVKLLLGLILTVFCGLRVTDGQALGFVLNGVIYPNGSTVLRTDIGEGTAALNCTTDSVTCCTNENGETRAGNFFFPDGSLVLTSGATHSDSYYRTRSSRLIGLNRRSTAMETGQFRCEIPNASGTTVNLFINIVNDLSTATSQSIPITPTTTPTTISSPPTTTEPDVSGTSISITASGTNTAGQTYSLECSATVTGSTDQPTITWLDNGGEITSDATRTVSVTTMNPGDGTYSSTLTFNPLAGSHAGIYTCRVTAGGVTRTQTTTVIVNVITAQVSRSSSGPLTAGQTGFSLGCDVTGTENLNTQNAPSFTYQWRRNGRVLSGQQRNTLSLSPLAASNAGEYICSVTVSSTSLSSTVTTNSSNTEIVSIQLPAPTSVTVTIINSEVYVGTDVTLTCTVELSTVTTVDVQVTVNTVWTGPAGFMNTKTAQAVMGSTTTYASTTIVGSLRRDQSGDYICTATVRPMSISTYLTRSGVLSNTATVRATTPPPLNVQATQASASAPVEVSWSPPSGGAATITGYRVFYGNGKNVSEPSDVTGIILALNENSLGQTVSVRSEADELASQLITVTITTARKEISTQDVVTKSSHTCALETGITVGVILLLVCLVATVITVVFICIQRKRRAGKNDLDQLTSMPAQLYENPDKLTSSGQGSYELTECLAYESTATKPQPYPTEVDQSSHYEL